MSEHTRRRWRRAMVGGAAVAVAVAAVVVPAAPASAADPAITAAEQPFHAYYSLGKIHSAGYTGRGVTIALIDGPVNTRIPELTGASIEDSKPCSVQSQDKYWDHGTVIAQVMVAPDFGVAPGAHLRSYTLSFEGDQAGSDCAIGDWGRARSDLALLIESALNDGVDVITTSSSYPSSYEGMRWALARAITRKVPVVACTGNDGVRNSAEWLPAWSGVVGVGAIEEDGTTASYSNGGDPVSTAALARPNYRSATDGQRYRGWGTSYATPVVAASLALSMQRWPRATGDQILQGLARTGVGGDGGKWNPSTGYGAVDPYAMLTTDPTRFPDENPFMDKGAEPVPSRRDVQDYADGVVDPSRIAGDDSYAYLGFDEYIALRAKHGYPTHLGASPRYHRR